LLRNDLHQLHGLPATRATQNGWHDISGWESTGTADVVQHPEVLNDIAVQQQMARQAYEVRAVTISAQ